MTMNSALKTAITQAGKAGITFSKKFLEQYETMNANARNADIVSTDTELIGAIINAQTNGKDPLTDPDVIRNVIAVSITSRNLTGPIKDWAETQTRELLNEHKNALFETVAKASRELGETLTEANKHMGGINIEEANTAVIKGEPYVTAWRTANDALAKWGYLEKTWMQLAIATQTRKPQGRGSLLRSPAYNVKNRHKIPENGTVWELVHEYQLPVALPNLTEWSQRQKELTTAIAAKIVADEAQAVKSFFAGTRLPVPS